MKTYHTGFTCATCSKYGPTLLYGKWDDWSYPAYCSTCNHQCKRKWHCNQCWMTHYRKSGWIQNTANAEGIEETDNNMRTLDLRNFLATIDHDSIVPRSQPYPSRRPLISDDERVRLQNVIEKNAAKYMEYDTSHPPQGAQSSQDPQLRSKNTATPEQNTPTPEQTTQNDTSTTQPATNDADTLSEQARPNNRSSKLVYPVPSHTGQDRSVFTACLELLAAESPEKQKQVIGEQLMPAVHEVMNLDAMSHYHTHSQQQDETNSEVAAHITVIILDKESTKIFNLTGCDQQLHIVANNISQVIPTAHPSGAHAANLTSPMRVAPANCLQ